MRRVFLSGSVVIMTLLISMSEGFAQAPGESPAVPAMSSGTMAGPTAGSPPPSLALRRDQPEDDGPMAAPRDADRGAESSGGMKTTPARPDSGMSDMGGMMSMGGDEHASHHPGMGDMSSMGNAGGSSSKPAGMEGMMGRMLPEAGQALSATPGSDKADAGCCGARGRTPLYTFMMTHPNLTSEERQMLADIAAQRMQDGLREIGAASVDAGQSMSLEAMRRSSQDIHEGVSLLDSGMAARAAATGLVNPQIVAFNWFNTQMGLPAAETRQQNSIFFGLTPAHLVFMTILILVSIALLILQILRLHRVQEILNATRVSVPQPPSPPAPPSPMNNGPKPPVPPTPGSGDGTVVSTVIPPRQGLWRGSLKVARVIRETPAIATFYLVPADGGRIPFDFKPGQFVQLTIEPTSGKPATRSYTIASSPGRIEHLELTIKREEQGLVSRYLHDTVKEGDLLKIAGPSGMFTFTGEEADSIVLLSGGVGITPMMAVLRYLSDIVWPGDIYFVYSAHESADYVFRQEIEWLERRNDKLRVIATMRRSPGTEWSGPEGRITKELLQQSVPDLVNRRIHVCGPPGMMASMKTMLADLGVPAANVHSEAFGPAAMKPAPAAVAATPTRGSSSPATTPAATTITFSTSGKSAPLQLDESVLDAADAAGVTIPSSCRSGICGMCMTHLLQGQVTMAVEDGLDPADKAKGFILACQAKTTGGPLVVEA
jgi:ferredoxin-NADP reductase